MAVDETAFSEFAGAGHRNAERPASLEAVVAKRVECNQYDPEFGGRRRAGHDQASTDQRQPQ